MSPNEAKKSNWVERLTLIFLLLQGAGLVLVYVAYEGKFYEASAEFARVSTKLVEQETRAKKVEEAYTASLKEQELAINNLQIVIDEAKVAAEGTMRLLRNQEAAEKIVPRLTIDGVHQIQLSSAPGKLVSSLAYTFGNRSVNPITIDAIEIRIFYAPVNSGSFPVSNGLLLLNGPEEDGPLKWKMVEQIANASRYFIDHVDDYVELPDYSQLLNQATINEGYMSGIIGGTCSLETPIKESMIYSLSFAEGAKVEAMARIYYHYKLPEADKPTHRVMRHTAHTMFRPGSAR
jgi:hypothetical protein